MNGHLKQFVFFQSTAEDEMNSFYGELQQNVTGVDVDRTTFAPGVYGVSDDGNCYRITSESDSEQNRPDCAIGSSVTI